MLEKLIKKLSSCVLAAMLSGAVNLKCVSEYEPLTTEINYSSYSSQNSANRVFVTGENIDVFVRLNENADRVYIEEERQNRDGTITNSYEMNNVGERSYTYKLDSFSDASILCFTIKVDRNGDSDYSNRTCEQILVSEKDAFDITKTWLDSRNTEFIENVRYNINERINYNNLSIEADFNLKKAEGITLSNNTIIEYIGENDGYTNMTLEEEELNERNVTNIYIKPYYSAGSFPTPNDLTTKQDLENKVSNFYYSLLL